MVHFDFRSLVTLCPLTICMVTLKNIHPTGEPHSPIARFDGPHQGRRIKRLAVPACGCTLECLANERMQLVKYAG